jgi:hypothetical protein
MERLSSKSVCIQSSIKWRVYIEKWANNPNTLQMMTKIWHLYMYNLSPTTGSNILGNQLMQKFLVSSFKYTISGNLCRNSGGTFKEWGYQEVPLVLFCMEVLLTYLGVAKMVT